MSSDKGAQGNLLAGLRCGIERAMPRGKNGDDLAALARQLPLAVGYGDATPTDTHVPARSIWTIAGVRQAMEPSKTMNRRITGPPEMPVGRPGWTLMKLSGALVGT
jgi:hypothetical protein